MMSATDQNPKGKISTISLVEYIKLQLVKVAHRTVEEDDGAEENERRNAEIKSILYPLRERTGWQ